jgi:predicted enzyme related to lactoylglutathione lyase
MANLVNWLEIPVKDMERAKKFYQDVLQAEISVNDQMPPGFKMGFIHTPGMKPTDVGGALVEGHGYEPGQNNVLVYFNANELGGVDAFLERVQQEGGRVTGPKMLVSGEIGFCGFFIDSEGNRMAVHSMQ